MNRKLQTLRNIAANWSGMIVNIIVGFALAPFILHRLGDVAFGLYALAFSFTGYYGLLDFGIRSSVIRYVARFNATGESDQFNRLVNTGLASYSALALVILAATVALSARAAALFHVPASYAATTGALFVVVGTGVALGLPLMVFGSVLEGLQRFVYLNAVQVAGTTVRAVLIVLALTHGYGVLALAVITVGVNLLSCVPYVVAVVRQTPVLFGFRWISRDTLKTIISYGSVTFMCSIAQRFRFETDAIVIGTVLSVASITYFSIASKLTDYSTGLVQYLAQVLTPLSSEVDATGSIDQLRALVVAGNRACALVALPLGAGMIILGRPLIAAWVGPRYLSSYTVLVILVAVRTLYVSQAASTTVAFGMDRHRPLAFALLAEGLANLVLSIVLAHRWGILGVALGTSIPMMGTTLLFLPLFICRLVEMPLRKFLAETYVAPILLCIPLALALALYRHLYPALGYMNLAGGMAVAAVVYGAAFGWWFLTMDSLGKALRARMASYFARTPLG